MLFDQTPEKYGLSYQTAISAAYNTAAVCAGAESTPIKEVAYDRDLPLLWKVGLLPAPLAGGVPASQKVSLTQIRSTIIGLNDFHNHEDKVSSRSGKSCCPSI